MPVLRDDPFARGQRRRRRYAVSGWHCALIFVAVALLTLTRLEHSSVLQMQAQLRDWLAGPIGEVRLQLGSVTRFWQRVGHVFSDSDAELQGLRAENRELAKWKSRAKVLERRLADVSLLVGQRRDGQQHDRVIARVAAGTHGRLSRSLLLQTGRSDGIQDGFPAFGRYGLIGRTFETTDRSSRVLLLSDVNSRVPVLVGGNRVRAVSLGDGGEAARLGYIEKQGAISVGDKVITSGAAGVFPAGLTVGTVVFQSGQFRIALEGRNYPELYVELWMYVGPGSKLTGFMAARAFERQLQQKVQRPADSKKARQLGARSLPDRERVE